MTATGAATGAGTYSRAGPDTLTVDELTHVVPSLTPALVDVLAADSLPEAGLPIAADALGLDLRHLANVYVQTTVTT